MRFAAFFALLAAVGVAPINALPTSGSTTLNKRKCAEDWTKGCTAAVVVGGVGGGALVGTGVGGVTANAIKKARAKKFQALGGGYQPATYVVGDQTIGVVRQAPNIQAIGETQREALLTGHLAHPHQGGMEETAASLLHDAADAAAQAARRFGNPTVY
ncbi:hypothetical protein FRB96_007519 [Tulasnella sp. 330]|nr:hypothetical protein FRB96_007519 [Tulasnella sp. 330]KAG8879860.1 hypothetical protein FRB97_001337 [Tulasnella sp. 331]